MLKPNMQLLQDYSLNSHHTMRSPSVCRYFCTPKSKKDIEQLPELANKLNVPIRVIGRGSNLLLDESLSVLVVNPRNLGIDVIEETNEEVLIKVQGGEDWHSLVLWSVEQGLNGLENLALIPGSVGAAPVQNIGAYGVELQSAVVSVEAFDLISSQWCVFSKQECEFNYRDSVFKRNENQFLIFSVTMKLSKVLRPNLNYGPLIDLADVKNLTSEMICQRVIQIRSSKLPDPMELPNAGSFFKNPVVSSKVLSALKNHFPSIVSFPHGQDAKLAAGWLIEQCGLKGRADTNSGVGCFRNQALVLINPNEATARDILAWAQFVQRGVLDKFGVALEIEPRFWTE